MKVISGPQKGETFPIKISETQTNRLVIGLSWDPADSGLEKPLKQKSNPDILDDLVYYIKDVARSIIYIRYMEKSVKQDDEPDAQEDSGHYDLDLHCYIFDEQHNLIQKISPEFEEAIDEASSAYHSGDDFSGLGGFDDEQLHIETKKIPDQYKHFIIFVRSDCPHSLDEVRNPVIRIADSKTEKNVLKGEIAPPPHLNAYGFIFAHVFRDGKDWHVKNIGEYAAFDLDWENTLKSYL